MIPEARRVAEFLLELPSAALSPSPDPRDDPATIVIVLAPAYSIYPTACSAFTSSGFSAGAGMWYSASTLPHSSRSCGFIA